MNYKFLILTLFTMVLLFYGLHQGLYVAPEEKTMGEIQRIFYYHVPSAWTSFLCFFANFLVSISYLWLQRRLPVPNFAVAVPLMVLGAGVTRLPFMGVLPTLSSDASMYISGVGFVIFSAGLLFAMTKVLSPMSADAVAVATAEVGVVFCTIVLVTGPLWARPVWGIWWTWDARLTTTLILWLIYVSYLFLRHYAAGGQAPTLASVVAIIGFLDVPLVYMAIRWFRTQHPQPVMAGGSGSGLDPAMWTALLWNWAAFVAFGFLLIWMRYNLVRFQQRIDERHALAAMKAGAR